MVVIWVGPLLVYISARYWERKSACGRHNGWQTSLPNNVIVKLTVGPLQGRWLLFWSVLCRHLYRPAVGSANRHAVATTVGKRLAQRCYRQTNRWLTAGPVS